MKRIITPWKRTIARTLVLVVLTAALSGCLGATDDNGDGDNTNDARYAGFDAALAAPGPTAEPVRSDSPVRLKLLTPADTNAVDQGPQEVVVLLYDSDTGEPVTDAVMTLRADMPAMGHGTSGETDPAHDAHGVYAGETNFIMPGAWVLNLDAELPDGDYLEFDVEVAVGGGGMDGDGDGADDNDGDGGDGDGDGGDGMDHGGTDHGNHSMDGDGNGTDDGTHDAAYHDAKMANGTTHQAESARGALNLTLKLLEPTDPGNASTGEHALRVLLYDADADGPVTNATFDLESWMPAMNHGCMCDETDPAHNGSGVYAGETNHIMKGDWEVRLNATLPGGDWYYYALPFSVTQSG